MHSITEIARKDGRKYITPEDVTQALKKSGHSSDVIQRIRLEVLEVLAEQTEYGAVDWVFVH